MCRGTYELDEDDELDDGEHAFWMEDNGFRSIKGKTTNRIE